MKKIYLIRHGQSEDNTAARYQAPDSPLTEKGRDQARFAAERVSRLPIEAVVASPLPRARETAEIIAAKTGKAVEFSELFVERKKTGEAVRPRT
jgi:broad specificity phosphatase PhoE